MARKRRPRRIGGPTAAEITEWHKRRDQGESLASIADRYGVGRDTVSFYTPGCKGAWTKVATPERIEDWIARRKSGESCWSIALDCGVCHGTVFYHTQGIPNSARSGPPRVFDPDYIMALTKKGLSDSLISARLGCAPSTPSAIKSKLKRKERENGNTDCPARRLGSPAAAGP